MHYNKVVVVAIVGMFAMIVALVAGILTCLAGGSYVGAVQSGGMSFGAAMTLGLMVASALGAL